MRSPKCIETTGRKHLGPLAVSFAELSGRPLSEISLSETLADMHNIKLPTYPGYCMPNKQTYTSS